MIDRKRLVQTLLGVYAFYDRELTEIAIRLWSSALDGTDADAIDAAFDQHLRDTDSGRFCPKPADILRHIRGSADDAALLAWSDVLEAARMGGSRFDGATQLALDSVGGMYALRVCDETRLGFMQSRFMAAFKTFQAREDAPAVLRLVSGATKRLEKAA